MFQERYRNYTNTELLKIVLRPYEYQPEAVAAAQEILTGRKVRDEERSEVEAFYQQRDAVSTAKRERVEKWEGMVRDFFDPIQNPKETLDLRRWVNIMIFVVTLLYLKSNFRRARSYVSWWNDLMRSFDPWMITGIFGMAYDLAMLVLLFRKSRWGWMLLFADLFVSFLYRVAGIYTFIAFYDPHFSRPAQFIISLLVNVGLLIFLARKPVMDQFGINKKQAQRTALVAVSLMFLWYMFENIVVNAF